MLRRLAFLLAALAAPVALTPTAALAAAGHGAASVVPARPDTNCSRDVNIPQRSVTGYQAAARITHARQIDIGPGVSETTTKTATEINSITASTTKSGGGSISAGWLWAKVEGHYSEKVGHTGQHTVTTSVKVTDTVRNTSKHNRAFIVFQGVTWFHGTFKEKICHGDPAGHWVTTTGTWRTFSQINASGIILCQKSKHDTAVERAAIKLCQ